MSGARREVTVTIREDECKGCGLCAAVCPPEVLRLSDRLNRVGYHPVSYVGTGCTGCGVCFYSCPEPGALSIRCEPVPAAR